jgi:hypothetical protein
VSNHHVTLVTILKMLIGLVNHVMPLVVNVPDHPVTNVLNVVHLKLILIYITDNVSLHVQMVYMLTMEVVMNVTINVVLVLLVLKMPVSPVVITYTTTTINV